MKEFKAELESKNQETSKAEVAEFNSNPPDKYFVYVKREAPGSTACRATTWMGDVLGTGTLGHRYEVPAFGGFPSVRRSIKFAGVNGFLYVGTYFESSGDYARVRMTAQSKRRLAAKQEVA